MFSELWKLLLDILYPPKCVGCKEAVNVHGEWCVVCQRDFFAPREINAQNHKLKWLNMCCAVCEYKGSLKRIIHDLKFRQYKRYALQLGEFLKEGAKLSRFGKIDMVIPVPLSKERLNERGYNQTEYIFKKWVQAHDLVWSSEILVRTKHTNPQWELKRQERWKNIQDAFCIMRPEMVRNKHILLVDDIFTTGITLDECAKVLKKAGAKKVHALVLASGAR